MRVLSTGNARKNDRLDATFTALAALRNERLARVHPEDGLEGCVEILRLLTERGENMVAERTRALNRLHVLLRDLLSDGVAPRVSRQRLPQSFCAALVPITQRDGPESGWPPSWCAMFAPSIGRSPLWRSASGRRWRLPAPPSPRSSA